MMNLNKQTSAELKFMCALIAFLCTWVINEEWIFNKVFDWHYSRAIIGINQILNREEVNKGGIGFHEVIELLNPSAESGVILKVRWGSIFGDERNQSVTYWFIGVNELGEKDKKLAEVTYSTIELEKIIYQKYKAPFTQSIAAMKKLLLIVTAVYGLYELWPLKNRKIRKHR